MFKSMFRNKMSTRTSIVYKNIILTMSDTKGLRTVAFFYFSWGNAWRISTQKIQNNIKKKKNLSQEKYDSNYRNSETSLR